MTLQHGLQQHTVLVTQHFGPQQHEQQHGSQQEQQQGSQHEPQHEPQPHPQPQPGILIVIMKGCFQSTKTIHQCPHMTIPDMNM
ncbi:unnamed protein product [Adineta steineri]|uniref:Uncharacterized protein n=1 Tax=Adineta steineri TaxID=433720 RepID=A0A819PER7_9BILA|nr:unnamed protein product [Adineta steineri]CAF4011716.1 unnamed protein product [Adineta steineri]